jgi:hypothetical protein
MATRALYARRSQDGWVAGLTAFIWATAILSLSRFLREPGGLSLVQLVASGIPSIAMGLGLRARARPIVEISESHVKLSLVCTLWPRRLELSQVASIEDETNLVGRLWETLRVRLESGEVVRILLTSLEPEDRALLRSVLQQAVRA